MDNRFDDLTKALAEGIPRRQALRRLAGLVGGALLGTLAFGGLAGADQGGCPLGTVRCTPQGRKVCCPSGTCCFTCSGPVCCPPGTVCNCDIGTCPSGKPSGGSGGTVCSCGPPL